MRRQSAGARFRRWPLLGFGGGGSDREALASFVTPSERSHGWREGVTVLPAVPKQVLSGFPVAGLR